jgi:uncharacterized protein (TIGR00251 family)
VKFNVVVKSNARKNAVETRQDGSLVVYVSTPPIEGRANERLVQVLAEHFGRPKRDIVIVSGVRSKRKIVEVR